jgi:hypothetical protein
MASIDFLGISPDFESELNKESTQFHNVLDDRQILVQYGFVEGLDFYVRSDGLVIYTEAGEAKKKKLSSQKTESPSIIPQGIKRAPITVVDTLEATKVRPLSWGVFVVLAAVAAGTIYTIKG